MRTLLFLALSATMFAVEIPTGVHVLLKMQNTLNSKTAAVGDYVYLQTSTPVAVDGKIVVPIGSYVQGVVTHVVRPGKVKGRAQLALRMDTLTLPSGQQYKFKARVASADGNNAGQRIVDKESTIEQGSSVGQDVKTVAGWATTGAIVGVFSGGWTNDGGQAAQRAGFGAAAGSLVGLATTLFTRGNEVELNQGSALDVVFDSAVALE
jgi:type IV secretion system protein VirB10